jgi:hypothetical protein
MRPLSKLIERFWLPQNGLGLISLLKQKQSTIFFIAPTWVKMNVKLSDLFTQNYPVHPPGTEIFQGLTPCMSGGIDKGIRLTKLRRLCRKGQLEISFALATYGYQRL